MSTRQASNKKQQESRSNLIYWILGGVIGLGLIVWMAIAIASEGDVDESLAFGQVTVEGEGLPFFQSGAADPAVGLAAPTVTGGDWNGEEFTIGADGRAKIIVMLAHWCPHCQAELPLLVDWVDSGGLPEDVDIYGVTVLTNRLRDSSTWPPGDWLDAAGWTSPTIMDDAEGSAAEAYGLTSTPTYIVLDGDNNNLGRVAGEVGTAGLEFLATLAQSSYEDG